MSKIQRPESLQPLHKHIHHTRDNIIIYAILQDTCA